MVGVQVPKPEAAIAVVAVSCAGEEEGRSSGGQEGKKEGLWLHVEKLGIKVRPPVVIKYVQKAGKNVVRSTRNEWRVNSVNE